MIELRGVTVRYGSRTALQDVSLRVAPGDAVLVSGASGCGKSTLARVIAGLSPGAVAAEVTGEVRVAGVDPRQTASARMAARVGLVFQNPATQLFCLTVEEEAAFGPRNVGLREDEVGRRVDWALEVTGLSGMRDRSPRELSSGEQQRVAIAAALALRPVVLLLDEPLASLDAAGAAQVLRTLEGLNRDHGITLLFFEHRLDEVAPFVRRAVLLERGRVVGDGPSEAILRDVTALDSLGLLRRRAAGPAVGEGGERRAGDPSAPVLVELREVSAGYNGHPAIRDVNLRLRAGEFVALVGENGAGKSTLARVLAGVLRPASGRRTLDGARHDRPGADVGLLLQNPLDQLLTDRVDDEVSLAPRNWRSFDRARHDETLVVTDLEELRERSPMTLSAGQQQRTVLAATLATRPRLVILDEPTLGQDWRHLRQLMDFVARLNAEGCAVLLITHDRDLATRYARRTLVMSGGRLLDDGARPGEETAA